MHACLLAPLTRCSYILAFMIFSGFFNVYCLRVVLSVVRPRRCGPVAHLHAGDRGHPEPVQLVDGDQGVCAVRLLLRLHCHDAAGRLDCHPLWRQGTCCAAVSRHHVSQWVFGVSVLGAAVLTLLTPLAAKHYPLIMALRILEGLLEVPSIYVIIAIPNICRPAASQPRMRCGPSGPRPPSARSWPPLRSLVRAAQHLARHTPQQDATSAPSSRSSPLDTCAAATFWAVWQRGSS